MDNAAENERTSLGALPYTSLRGAAYVGIRDAILQGKLRAGQRLLEVELSHDLGISRAPVREALRELEREGLVRSSPHRGTHVADFAPEDAREVYSLRAVLEGLALRRAAQFEPADLLGRLETFVGQMEAAAACAQLQDMVQADFSFHETLCRAARHKRLFDVWQGMRGQIRAFVSITAMQYLPAADIAHRHRQLLEALQEGHIEGAVRQLTTDILQVGEYVASEMSSERELTAG